MIKRMTAAILLAAMLLTLITQGLTPARVQANGSGFTNYITRTGDKLMDGGSEFRFISWNVPSLIINEDPTLHVTTAWEMEDAIRSVAQMGGQVIRIMHFTVKKSPTDTAKRFIYGRDGSGNMQYDEELFQTLDKALQLCNQYGIRLIIPFTNDVEGFGGRAAFANLRGKTADEFYTDTTVISDFKEVMNTIMNRTNTYTSVKYKDDKAILAWETGNELHAPDAWISDIAAYFQSVNTNQLLMDGNWGTLSQASINNPDVDIMSNHYYSNTNLAGTVDAERALTIGKKPLIVGEIGLTATLNMSKMFDRVIQNGTSGAMIWSLRFHNKDGGYYQHRENSSYYAYHYPISSEATGYPITNDQAKVVEMMINKAYAIRGMAVPAPPIPDAPTLLPISSVQKISWQGSTGAESYDIERAADTAGPWSVVAVDVLDVNNPYEPFNDRSAIGGSSYYYRVVAQNVSGRSSYSNVVGPVSAPISSSANLTANGEFELGSYGWTLDAGAFTLTSSDKQAGQYSLKTANLGAGKSAKHTAAVRQKTNYALSVFAKTAAGGAASIKVTDASGNTLGIAGTTDASNVQATTANGVWTEYTVRFNSGSNSSVIVQLMDNSTAASTFFDEVELRQQPNYAMNGGFEYGSSGWNLGTSGAAVVTTDAKSGTSSLKTAGAGSYKGVTQTLTVLPNTNYVLSFYAKGQNPRVKVTSDGGLANTLTNGVYTVSPTAWTPVSIPFNSGAFSTLYLTLYEGSTPTVTYIDDIQLIQNPILTTNSGFESGSLAWTLGGGASVVTTEKYAGTSSLKTGGAGNYVYSSQNITVQSGGQYTISLYAKGQGGRYKVTSSDLSKTLLDIAIPASPDWTLHTKEFSSGSYTSLKVLLTEPGSAATTYFDEVEVREKPEIAVDTNQVKNGSLETGIAFPWTLSPSFALSSADKRLGLGSLKLTGTGGGGTAAQTVTVVPNKDYTLTFYSKTVSGTMGYKIQSGSAALTSGTSKSGAGWQRNTIDFNSGTHTSVEVVLEDTGGSLYVDDFVLDFKVPIDPRVYNWFVDNFEVYGGSVDPNAALTSAWARNGGGGTITTTLDTVNKSEGSSGMKYQYDFAGKTYAGAAIGLGKNWYEYAGVSFWMKPDNSGNTLTVQFSDASGYGWEKNITLTGTSPQLVTIPFNQFQLAAWVADRNAVLDLSTITSFAFYVGQTSGAPAAGTLYFDDIKAYELVNLIQNPGFESGATGWTLQTGFTISGDSVSAGSQAAKLVAGGVYRNLYQTVTVEPNTSYTLTLRSNSGRANTFKVMNTAWSAIALGNTTGNQTWTTYSLTFNSGSLTSVVVAVTGTGTETSYFDDFSLTKNE
ncbi:carbohydrate binding domain-containing protein [Paenibacillus sp. GCM10023252]|uniref:carbohydrate binding domain-containing protein n=1 Tax=Paenibacillus sp. GCM10023252 TaxID=3252649 RepID=UPI00360DA53D